MGNNSWPDFTRWSINAKEPDICKISWMGLNHAHWLFDRFVYYSKVIIDDKAVVLCSVSSPMKCWISWEEGKNCLST